MKTLAIALIATSQIAIAGPYFDLDEPLPKILRTPGSDNARLVGVKKGLADYPLAEDFIPMINVQWDFVPRTPEGSSGVGMGYVFKGSRRQTEDGYSGSLEAYYNFGGWADSYAWDESGPGGGHDAVGTFGICRSMEESNARCWGLYGDAILKNTWGTAIGGEVVVRNLSSQPAPKTLSARGGTIGFTIASKTNPEKGGTFGTVGLWMAANKVSGFHTGIDFAPYSVAPDGAMVDLSKSLHAGVAPLLLPHHGGIYARNFDGSRTRLIGPQAKGWDMPYGPETRSAFDASTASCSDVAARLNALLRDLAAHGLIGR